MILCRWQLFRNAPSGMVTQAEFESIAPFVTAVSLMTYDYSHPQRYSLLVTLTLILVGCSPLCNNDRSKSRLFG